MAMDLNALQQLLNQSSGAAGRVSGLEEQLARANVLRDTPSPTPTAQMSYTHPLEHIARGLRRSRGEREATAATGGLSQARQQLADAQIGKTMYGLRTTAANRLSDEDFRKLKETNLTARALTKAIAVKAAAKLAHDNKVAETKRQEEYTQGQFGDHETVWKTDDNTPIQVAIADDGKSYINVHTSEVITEPFTTQNPHAKGGKLYVTPVGGASAVPFVDGKGTDVYGNDIDYSYDRRDGERHPSYFRTGEKWTEKLAKKKGAQIAGQAGSETLAKEESKTNIRLRSEAQAKLKSLYTLESQLNTSINALTDGAETGPIASRLPSIRQSTIVLENMRDRMALTEIGSHTFGSLSNAEGQWLKSVSIPMNMNEDKLKPWLQHRLKGMQNVIEATKYENEMLEAGYVPDTNEIQRILHSDGYKFEDL